jgi:Spy/CpxP family protein refolding chaperone
MNRRTLIITTLVALAALAVVPFVYAQAHGHRGHGDGMGIMMLGRLDKAKEALGLTDDQVNQIKTIATDLHQQNAAYRDQLRGGHKAVMQALLNNPNDVAGAQALLDQQTAAEKAMKSNMLNAASKALNVLTPDQRAKVGQFMAERQARHNR